MTVCMKTLADTAYPTDKLAHGYLDHYQEVFNDLQEKRNAAVYDNDLYLRVLEIGVMSGNSLRIWRDALSTEFVYGIDHEPKFVFDEPGIKVFQGSQEDVVFLRRVVAETGSLDIIIDDGGHRAYQHIASFDFLWKHVQPGGWYCIEDCFSMWNDCWTRPGERLFVDLLDDRWETILTGQDDIQEVRIIGRNPNDGLILINKRD